MANIEKDATILELLDQLKAVFGARGFAIVDHWDADLCSVGIAQPGNDRPLLYISTWMRDSGHYHADLEFPAHPGSDQPYQQGPEFHDVDFAEVVGLLEKHIGIRRTNMPTNGAA